MAGTVGEIKPPAVQIAVRGLLPVKDCNLRRISPVHHSKPSLIIPFLRIFEVFLLLGYACGIVRKVIQLTAMDASGALFYLSFFFYILNFVMISIDVALYF